jgi:pyruvate dehydrogenase (quinone)
MVLTAADILLDTLHRWGVEVIFGLPGDGISGVMEALGRRSGKIRFIQTRHEEAAAFMACGYAKFTGKLGVCLSSSGSGGIHLLNGLYDARLDGQPMLAITGTRLRTAIDSYGHQDVALDRLYIDVALYNTVINGVEHIENAANLACRAALTERGVAHLNFPIDLQKTPLKNQRSSRGVNSTVSFARRARLPYEGDLRRAAETLNSGRRVAILVGRGSLGAASELELVAEILGAPIVKSLMGKASLADDSPYTTGGAGPLGTSPSLAVLQSCDTLLMVGTSFPYVDYLPEAGRARTIQIDSDPTRIGLRCPVEVGLVGDSQRTLKELLPLLTYHADRSFLEKAQKNMMKWRKSLERDELSQARPLKPQAVASILGRLMDEDAIFACDGGNVAAWWARHLPAKVGQMHAISGNLGAAGSALSYANAAQTAFPNRQCLAFCGDGGFSMLMAEFATSVKYDLPVKVVILKNRRPAPLEHWSEVDVYSQAYSLQPIQFADFARACGGKGFTIQDPQECETVLAEALDEPGPVIVEVEVDTNELPERVLSGKADREEAGGGPDSGGEIDVALITEKVREMIQEMTGKSSKE